MPRDLPSYIALMLALATIVAGCTIGRHMADGLPRAPIVEFAR